MILTCPNCSTQYVVKDGAIPPGGRQVRCAACKHSWHQNPHEVVGESETIPAPPPIDNAEAEPQSAPVTEEADESFAEASLIEPRSGPEAEERAFEEAVVEEAPAEKPVAAESEPHAAPPAAAGEAPQPVVEDWREPPEPEPEDDQFSPFVPEDEVEPRRRRPLVAILLVLAVVAALAAAFWFLAPPEWKARLGIGAAGASPLALVTTHMDRQRLESGNELLTVTGRVINPTSKEQDVPPLQAQLRTRTGQVVYSWTIQPPARTLPPGASASFNSAEVNVPPGGEELTITLGLPRA